MTTTALRRVDPRPFLPLFVLVVLLACAALLALIAPSRVTTGVYQVWVDGVTITTESLSCQRLGDRAECTVPVGGRELAITVVRTHPNTIVPGTCTAVHGDRRVSCDALQADYGHASHSVLITDSLELTEAELAAWQDRVPWWRMSEGLVRTGALLIGLLALAMGGISFLLGGRVRPRHPWRPQVVIGTGLVGLVLFGVASQFMGASVSQALFMLFVPPTILAAAVLAVWQWQLGVMSDGTVLARWGYAVTAAVVTVAYLVTAMFVFLLYSGFIDRNAGQVVASRTLTHPECNVRTTPVCHERGLRVFYAPVVPVRCVRDGDGEGVLDRRSSSTLLGVGAPIPMIDMIHCGV